MSLAAIPKRTQSRYTIDERHHAAAILSSDFINEFQDIVQCMDAFTLKKSEILKPGGRKSSIADRFDNFLQDPSRGWQEKSFDIQVSVDGATVPMPTHKIDNFKNRVGVEVEWNNKTGNSLAE